jgi:hypothetical protein
VISSELLKDQSLVLLAGKMKEGGREVIPAASSPDLCIRTKKL